MAPGALLTFPPDAIITRWGQRDILARLQSLSHLGEAGRPSCGGLLLVIQGAATADLFAALRAWTRDPIQEFADFLPKVPGVYGIGYRELLFPCHLPHDLLGESLIRSAKQPPSGNVDHSATSTAVTGGAKKAAGGPPNRSKGGGGSGGKKKTAVPSLGKHDESASLNEAESGDTLLGASAEIDDGAKSCPRCAGLGEGTRPSHELCEACIRVSAVAPARAAAAPIKQDPGGASAPADPAHTDGAIPLKFAPIKKRKLMILNATKAVAVSSPPLPGQQTAPRASSPTRIPAGDNPERKPSLDQ